MPIKNYHPSEFVTKNYKTTAVYTKEDGNLASYDFRVDGNVNTIAEFVEAYISEREQTWKDNDYDEGVWSKTVDNGYQNLMNVLNSGKYYFKHINWSSDHRIPAWGTCCGYNIELSSFTNTCHECGTDYNSGGQRLAPRHHWGEETGEHWSECY